ncbi:MAG TPA: hypothetical protein VGD56_10785, partial [Gemmatirosa sp.]
MPFHVRSLVSLAAVTALAACAADRTTGVAGPSASLDADALAGRAHRFVHTRVCPVASPGEARCHSYIRMDGKGQPLATSAPSGYGPSDIRAAYGLTSVSASGGGGQTIAIVDAYDDPNAESDLAVYRSHFGLPACTTANGCFRKVNQSGGTRYPSANAGWAEEISLDLDMASAVCPNCKILLVE